MTATEPLPRNLVIRALATDCQAQADETFDQLEEVLERLREGDHLAALGATQSLSERVLYVTVVLERLAAITCSNLTDLPN